ncbi:hypothetical protein JNM05_15585 [bacterium]|nr:hypothetical protein [bacterium]
MKRILRKLKKALPSQTEYYYSRSRYYERLSAKYGNIRSYVSLLSAGNKLASVESAVSAKPELGGSSEDVLKKYGEPHCRLANITVLKNQILFYKFLLGGHKTKCEMHFFKNKMFLFTYTFSYLTPNDKIKLVESLSKKYLSKSIDLKNICITDEQGNKIFLHDSSDFIIYYLAAKSDFFKEAELIITREKDQNKKKSELHQKELLNRL